MKHTIIKSYSNWLNEALRVHEAAGTDPNAMYSAQDRAGLVALAQQNDSPEIKAHPAYNSVMEWWKKGEGDLNLIKSIIKSGSSRKTDKARSLKSVYYWSGSGSSERMNGALANFYKVADSIKRNGERLGLDANKLAGLEDAVAKLKQFQSEGFVPRVEQVLGALIPVAMVDNNLSGGSVKDVAAELDKPQPNPSLLKMIKSWKVGYYSTPELQKDPKTSIDWLDQQRTNQETSKNFWSASTKLTDADKKALLDEFQKRAEGYIKRKGGSIDMAKAISAATDLYIAPKNEKITITVDTTVEQPSPAPMVFSYPADPKGDQNSENFKKGLSLFPDDGVTVKPEVVTEINAMVKAAVDSIKAQGATIKAVSTWGYSSTSQVGSSYKSPSGQTGNVALSQDRLAAINKALADAVKANGIDAPVTVDATKNLADPNRGPAWTDADKTNPKWGKPGARTPEYEATYGPWRFSIGFISFTAEVPQTPTKTVSAVATPSGEWKSHISWADESISITPPRLPNFIPGAPKMPKAGGRLACPTF